jgi:hypothetical protein
MEENRFFYENYKTSAQEFLTLYKNKEKIISISTFCNYKDKFTLCYINKNLNKIGKKYVINKLSEEVNDITNTILASEVQFIEYLLTRKVVFAYVPKELLENEGRKHDLIFTINIICSKLNQYFFDNKKKDLKIIHYSLPASIQYQNIPFLASLLSINKSFEYVDFSGLNNFLNYPGETYLNKKDYRFTSDLFRNIDRQKCWKSLNLSNVKLDKTWSLSTLIYSFKYLKQLTSLILTRNNLGRDSFIDLVRGMSELISLEYLNVSHNLLDDRSSYELFNTLCKLGSFKKLDAGKCNINNTFSANLTPLLLKQTITELIIPNNSLMGHLPVYLLDSFKYSRIINLNMENCNLFNDSIIKILEAFSSSNYIENINVGLNVIDSNIIPFISTFLEKNKTLKKLTINNAMTELHYSSGIAGGYLTKDYKKLTEELKKMNSERICWEK